MAVYKAPIKDIQFVLNEVIDVAKLAKLPGYEDATPDTIHAIVEEAAKLCENVLFPLNRTGDEEGCHYENGVVRTPKGFKEAYKQFAEGGWTGITCDPEYGGQGLPATVGFALQEMFTASNQAFASPSLASLRTITADFTNVMGVEAGAVFVCERGCSCDCPFNECFAVKASATARTSAEYPPSE